MSLHTDLIAAGLPVSGQAIEGQTVFFTRALTPQEEDTYERIVNPKNHLAISAGADFASIPNWSDMTKEQFITWWNSNLSDAMVDALSIPAGAKAMLKASNLAVYRLGLSVIALRNYTRILG